MYCQRILIAFCIGVGSTAQALLGRRLIKVYIGFPLNLLGVWEILKIFTLGGPLACLVATTIGNATLYISGIISIEKLPLNCLTWWIGDLIGIFIFLPLSLFLFPGSQGVQWKGKALGSLPVFGIILITVMLGITFYAWKVSSENSYDVAKRQFFEYTKESEKALLHRLESYQNALSGAAGFYLAFDEVSRKDWRAYTERIDISRNFPSIDGIGFIENVPTKDLQLFIDSERIYNQAPNFMIHPEILEGPNYIIKYIEPSETNAPALGLNIAFEKK